MFTYICDMLVTQKLENQYEECFVGVCGIKDQTHRRVLRSLNIHGRFYRKSKVIAKFSLKLPGDERDSLDQPTVYSPRDANRTCSLTNF